MNSQIPGLVFNLCCDLEVMLRQSFLYLFMVSVAPVVVCRDLFLVLQLGFSCDTVFLVATAFCSSAFVFSSLVCILYRNKIFYFYCMFLL